MILGHFISKKEVSGFFTHHPVQISTYFSNNLETLAFQKKVTCRNDRELYA